MIPGEIILLPFPFSDLSGAKVRPAVVLASDRQDIVVVFITTVKPSGEFVPIKATAINRLKQDSFIRYTKLASVEQKLAIGKIGELTAKEFKDLKKSIKQFLQL